MVFVVVFVIVVVVVVFVIVVVVAAVVVVVGVVCFFHCLKQIITTVYSELFLGNTYLTRSGVQCLIYIKGDNN